MENTDYAAFAGRVIRAYARRIAEGGVDGLTDLGDWPARWTLPPRLPSVDGLRGFGYPWAEIASRLGTSRQAAQQRWGRDRLSRHALQGLKGGHVERGKLGDHVGVPGPTSPSHLRESRRRTPSRGTN